MCYLPGVIQTKFGDGLIDCLPNKEIMWVTPYQCAKAGLRDLGYTSVTYGPALHDFISSALAFMDKTCHRLAISICLDTYVRANRNMRSKK